MPITAGQGNPDWTKDETILAFDMFIKCGRKAPGPNDPRVQELSELLQTIPWPSTVKRNSKFRNPAGVNMKFLNLNSAITGKGLSSCEMDRTVVALFEGKEADLRSTADAIRRVLNGANKHWPESLDEDDEEFAEGRFLTVTHKKRERNPQLRKLLLKRRTDQGRLFCEICAWKPTMLQPRFDDAGFEGHHILPLASAISNKTRVSDLALLCATCHRLVHRAIVLERRWLTMAECQQLLNNAK